MTHVGTKKEHIHDPADTSTHTVSLTVGTDICKNDNLAGCEAKVEKSLVTTKRPVTGDYNFALPLPTYAITESPFNS